MSPGFYGRFGSADLRCYLDGGLVDERELFKARFIFTGPQIATLLRWNVQFFAFSPSSTSRRMKFIRGVLSALNYLVKEPHHQPGLCGDQGGGRVQGQDRRHQSALADVQHGDEDVPPCCSRLVRAARW